MLNALSKSLVMSGRVGVPYAELTPDIQVWLERSLTIIPRAYKGTAAPIRAYAADQDFFWIPRYFDRQAVWPLVDDWRWTEGRDFDFECVARLDPERGQDVSVPAMERHVRAYDGGILIAPTGTGKTLCALSIAARFKRFIGIPLYVGHMFDNWVEHAKTVLGLTEDQIGVVQGDRCDLGKPVTIMMVQSLLARRYPDELYEQIGFLVADEVHRYGSHVWSTVVAQFPARYRLGLSANPNRRDGAGDVISWAFGQVGHRAQRLRSAAAQAPTVYAVAFDRDYDRKSFCDWTKDEDGNWVIGDNNAMKFDKVLAADQSRNAAIAADIAKAVKAGRKVIVLSRLTEHLETIKSLVFQALECNRRPAERIVQNIPYGPHHTFATLGTLAAGLNPAQREAVADADVIFATYSMAREALNVPSLDTMFFATPPGDPLQPVGRLREKAEGVDRKSLMIVDYYEAATPYSNSKVDRRIRDYRTLKISVSGSKRSLV